MISSKLHNQPLHSYQITTSSPCQCNWHDFLAGAGTFQYFWLGNSHSLSLKFEPQTRSSHSFANDLEIRWKRSLYKFDSLLPQNSLLKSNPKMSPLQFNSIPSLYLLLFRSFHQYYLVYSLSIHHYYFLTSKVFNGCIKNWKAFVEWNPANAGLDYLQVSLTF